tara:strand:- start:8354 stop:10288 length:1935 start_codon:yes stop_codon:yes gene_type:complete
MAIDLNPNADSTLVNVAYRAAMANTPADYSGTFEKAAASYEKTMQAQGKTWGNIAKLGTLIGSEMIENANELANYSVKAGGINPEYADIYMSEIQAIKDSRKELGLLPSLVGNQETRKKLAKLKIDQANLFAEIDFTAESIRKGTAAVGAGNYDAKLNERDAEMINAIIKSNLKDPVTNNQNFVKLSRDPNTEELVYTLYDKETNEPSLLGGKPQTMTIKEFNKSIATNVDDKGAMKNAFNTYNNKRANDGFKSTTGVYGMEERQLDSNMLDGMVKSPVDLRRAFRTSFGYEGTSFYDDIQRPSSLSASLFGTLLSNAESEVAEGELAVGGLTEGIEDKDNSGGISMKELQDATNYGKLSSNILGMVNPEASKALFKEYALDKLKASYEYGHNKRPPKPGDSDGNGDPYGFGAKSVELNAKRGSYVTQGQRITRRNHIENNENFQGAFGDYDWNKDVGGYILNGDTENPKTKWKVMQSEMLVGNNDRQVDFDSLGLQKSKTAFNTAGEEVTGGVTLDLLDGNDDDVASSLNNYIPKNSNYSFRPQTSSWNPFTKKYWTTGIAGFGGDDLLENAVELIDGSKNPIMWNGKPLILFTSSGGGRTKSKNEQDAAIANFNDWLEQQNDFELQTGGNTGVGVSEPEDVN